MLWLKSSVEGLSLQNIDGVLGKLLPKGLKQKIITTMTKGVSAAAKVCFDDNGATRHE
jgi:hypothetical protein